MYGPDCGCPQHPAPPLGHGLSLLSRMPGSTLHVNHVRVGDAVTVAAQSRAQKLLMDGATSPQLKTGHTDTGAFMLPGPNLPIHTAHKTTLAHLRII